jgi:uridine phosphorylase
MILVKDFPILEYDPDPNPIIQARQHLQPMDVSEACVLCFFRDAIADVLGKYPHRLVTTLKGEAEHLPVYELDYHGKKVVLHKACVGAPLAAGQLEELTAIGCRKFMVCGGAGVLDRELAVGHLIIPTSAVRDEGTSYHYMPPSREVEADPVVVAVIEEIFKARNVPYITAKTWTTDAFYRETRAKFARRKQEGCVTVEMESAAYFAVAKYLGVRFGQILYAGDNLDGDAWDNREWHKRTDIRTALLDLALEAVLRI